MSFIEALFPLIFSDLYPESLVYNDKKSYNTYFDKALSQQPEHAIVSIPYIVWTSVLLNQSTISTRGEDFTKTLIDHWVPRCYRKGDLDEPCNRAYLLQMTFPRNDDNREGKMR